MISLSAGSDPQLDGGVSRLYGPAHRHCAFDRHPDYIGGARMEFNQPAGLQLPRILQVGKVFLPAAILAGVPIK